MLKYSNFAKTTMDEDLTDVETVLTVADESNFPTSGNFMLVFWEAEYSSPLVSPNVEIVECTSVSGADFTIDRAEEGTTGVAWSTGDNVALVLTAGMLDEIEAEIGRAGSSINLVQNSCFTNMPYGLAVPVGWLIAVSGGGSAAFVSNTGYYSTGKTLGVTATGGTATLSCAYPTGTGITSKTSYSSLAVWAYKSDAAATMTINICDESVVAVKGTASVTATSSASRELVQVRAICDSAGKPIFSMTIDSGYTGYIEMPTIVPCAALTAPMLSAFDVTTVKSQYGANNKAPSGSVSETIAAANTTSIYPEYVLGTGGAGSSGIFSLQVSFTDIGASKAGRFTGIIYKTAGGTYYGPFVEGFSNDSNAYSATTVTASKVSLTWSTDHFIITNNLANSIRVISMYSWG